MKVLTEIEIEGLLGRVSRAIPFPEQSPFLLLHGPNGAGKTKLLELTSALLNGSLPLQSPPFEKIRAAFNDGSWLSLARECDVLCWRTSEGGVQKVRFEEATYERAVRDLVMQGFVRPVPHPGVQDRLYRDVESGERLTMAEAVVKYQDEVDESLVPVPMEVRKVLEGVKCNFIDVHRLRSVSEVDLEGLGGHRRERKLGPLDVISRELSARIAGAQSQQSLSSQTLDASYPSRLLNIDEQGVSGAALEEMRRKVESTRVRLVDAGLVRRVAPIIPDEEGRDLPAWKQSALLLHYEDSRRKLEQLAPMANLILAFKKIIEEKLVGKTVSVDAEQGLEVRSESGEVLALSHLSSGEQHEIVLAYHLVFESVAGSITLIDEPEISLHVGWQRQFLPDLEQIHALTGARFIVASHSPQVVGNYLRNLVSLGEVE